MAKMQYSGNRLSAPRWAGDFLDPIHLLPTPFRLDPTQFSDSLHPAVTLTAGPAQGDTTIAVSALTPGVNSSTVLIAQGNVVIPAGAVLDFGGTKFARVTADAVYGATSITVAALPTAMSIGDVAVYSPFNSKEIPSGTVVGRTIAERDAATAFGPAAITDDEIFLVAFDRPNVNENPDFEAYRPGSVVYEDFLPTYTTLNTAANEVQTLTFGAAATGGSLRLEVPKTDGSTVITDAITWNGTAATFLASINTALDAATGVAGGIVASGASPSTTIIFTFSGTGYAAKTWPLVDVRTFPTSTTTATVVKTTTGGKSLLSKLRQLYLCQRAEA